MRYNTKLFSNKIDKDAKMKVNISHQLEGKYGFAYTKAAIKQFDFAQPKILMLRHFGKWFSRCGEMVWLSYWDNPFFSSGLLLVSQAMVSQNIYLNDSRQLTKELSLHLSVEARTLPLLCSINIRGPGSFTDTMAILCLSDLSCNEVTLPLSKTWRENDTGNDRVDVPLTKQ